MIRYEDKFDRRDARPPPDQAEVEALLGDEVEALAPLAGGYRHTNLALRLRGVEGTVVLRLSDRDDATALQREAAALARVADLVPVPRVLRLGVDGAGRPWALHTFVEGRLLARVLEDERLGPVTWAEATRAVGEALARIHEVRLGGSGFLGADLTVTGPLGDLAAAFRAFTLDMLAHERALARLGPVLVRRTREFVERNGGLLEDLEETQALVHSDFNGKNLLIRDRGGQLEVAAVLDWEFAFAGCPLQDLGNFLRFAHERPPEVAAAFVAGYEDVRGRPLPRRWRRAAELLDLSALLEMATREEAGPRTVGTVREAVMRTVDGRGRG